MQILEFNLDGQKLTKASDFPDVVSNSNKYLKMVVKGIPDGFVATAYFILSWDTTSVYNLVIENGEVYIDEYLTTLPKDPSEYFDYTLSVSIAAVNGDGVRITSNPIIIKIDKSNFSPETTNTPKIPENQIEEVLAKISPATSETYGVVRVADDADMASITGGIYPDKSCYDRLSIVPAKEDQIDGRYGCGTVITPLNLEYAVKSVGDGYYAKVGEGGGGENWRLIRDDTLTEAADVYKVTADADGNAIALKKMMIEVYADTTEGVYPSTGNLVFNLCQGNYDKNWAKTLWSTAPFPTTDGKKSYIRFDAEVIGTNAFTTVSTQKDVEGFGYMQLGAATCVSRSQAFPLNRDNIGMLQLNYWGSGGMHVGTRIVVWGVDA